MFIKIHRSYRTVIAICDKSLIGKKFEEGNQKHDAPPQPKGRGLTEGARALDARGFPRPKERGFQNPRHRQLDLKEAFYKDSQMTMQETIALLKTQTREDATFNIVGKEAIKCAIQADLIIKEDVGYIAGIPFILVF